MDTSGSSLIGELALIAVSFAVALIATRLVIALAPRLRLLDRPGHRKTHKQPVAHGGGVAILVGIAAGLGLRVLLHGDDLTVRQLIKILLVSGAAALATLLGFLDDKYQIRPRHKLIVEAVIAGAFVLFGYRFQVLKVPGLDSVDLYYLAVPFTLFWILSVVNAVNLIDGVDGLAAAVVGTTLLLSGLAARTLGDHALLLLSAAGIGAVLGFLVFNWKPARVYLGDAGSLGLGMFVATSLVALGQDTMVNLEREGPAELFRNQVPLLTLLVAYPALEISISVLRRLLAGKAIGSADRSHIHHRLIDSGWDPRAICSLAILLSLLAGGFVVETLAGLTGRATWLLTLACLISGVVLHHCGYLSALQPSRLRGTRPRYLAAAHFIGMQQARLDLARSLGEVVTVLQQTALELGVRHYTLTLGGEARRDLDWARPAGHRGAFLDFGEASSGAPASVVHTETIELADRQGRANWTFDAREGSEDLAVEYRVLMSDFMVQALAKARAVPESRDGEEGTPARAVAAAGAGSAGAASVGSVAGAAAGVVATVVSGGESRKGGGGGGGGRGGGYTRV